MQNVRHNSIIVLTMLRLNACMRRKQQPKNDNKLTDVPYELNKRATTTSNYNYMAPTRFAHSITFHIHCNLHSFQCARARIRFVKMNYIKIVCSPCCGLFFLFCFGGFFFSFAGCVQHVVSRLLTLSRLLSFYETLIFGKKSSTRRKIK